MKEHGVTLIEMMAVLLILGIVSVVALSRVGRIDDMELATKVNTVRNHIRYTQIMAMKRNDMTWGIKCDGTDYWVFKTASPEVASEPDVENNMVVLPGYEQDTVDPMDEKKIAMPSMSAFTLYFDKYGIPYKYDTGTSDIVPRTSNQTIQIGSKTLTVIEQTGFVE
jgi:prepilin-type N-terminal cleavage/methylation domain-containing protein